MKPRLQTMNAKYDGYCSECRRTIARNTPAVYDWHLKRMMCTECAKVAPVREGALFDQP